MDTKTLSIVGLVLGILFPIAGIIVSAVALNKMKQGNCTMDASGNPDGKNLAMAGLIIGIVLTALSVVGAICGVCMSLGAIASLSAGY